jgi:hypothetical protein
MQPGHRPQRQVRPVGSTQNTGRGAPPQNMPSLARSTGVEDVTRGSKVRSGQLFEGNPITLFRVWVQDKSENRNPATE